MQYSRQFWYTFFSEFGFLIMPCAFNWRSTTSWLFDAGEENEIALNDEQFKITYTGIHCFFYRINATLLKQHLPLFRLTNTLIRNKLVRDNIVLEIPPHYAEHPLYKVRRYESKNTCKVFR